MLAPEEILELVNALFSAWNRETTPDVYTAYEMALGDLTLEQARFGVTRAIRTPSEHPPSAGQVRAYCIGKSEKDLEAQAHAAFERADRLAKSVGLEANPKQLNDHLLTHAIGAVGGWTAFCTAAIDHWQKKNFVDAYVAAAGNPQLDNVAKLSHGGEPIGALPQVRLQLANKLGRDGDC